MTNAEQDARALAIRDHLLPLIQAHGALEEVSGMAGRVARWRVGGFICLLRSPFTPWPAEVPIASYDQAISRQRAKRVLPWGLEVWSGHKMLSLQWDDEGQVDVTSFQRGPWEVEALALGAEPSPSR
ncbi:hypothetical protein [Paracraurococcus lichenis]|uniref:Uncharacterized protein n=1 Tax=Paracraurococcus lichenis TaxID=3064888 RepID=A0ABT9EEB3_9PROT|nr:hypothetical protein [Paracraurococcus sp. LOR1-02]MDO9714323.1 hypothetical protein [Paracraurococcus sp. LOR1-02]